MVGGRSGGTAGVIVLGGSLGAGGLTGCSLGAGGFAGGSLGAGGLASGSLAGSTSGTVGGCDDGMTGDGDGDGGSVGAGIAVLIGGGAFDGDVGNGGDAVGSSVGVTAVGRFAGSGATDAASEAVGSAADPLGTGGADTIGGGVRAEMFGDATEPSGAVDAAGSGGTGDAVACPAAITTVPRKTIA